MIPANRPIFTFKAVVLALVSLFQGFAAESPELSTARSLYEQGKTTEARSALEKILKNVPSDPNVKVLYARTLDPEKGIRILDSIGNCKDVSPQTRAQSLTLVGDYHFLKEDYKSASSFYEQASWQKNSSIYRHLHALAAYMTGDQKTADALWLDIAQNDEDSMSVAADLYRAYILMQKAEWSQAYQTLQKHALPDSSSGWHVPYLKALFECARKTGDLDKTALHEGQLLRIKEQKLEDEPEAVHNPGTEKEKPESSSGNQKQKETISENKIVKTIEIKEAKKIEASPSLPLKTDQQSYTVQVGAFGSKENAENLKKKLSTDYKNVMIVPSAGLYKVRIGIFDSEEDATSFAESSLKKQGYSTRVVSSDQ